MATEGDSIGALLLRTSLLVILILERLIQESMIVGTRGRLIVGDQGARITHMQAGLETEIMIRTGVTALASDPSQPFEYRSKFCSKLPVSAVLRVRVPVVCGKIDIDTKA